MSSTPQAGGRARRRRYDVAGVLCAALLLALPAILSRDGFSYDFTNHLWLVWVQDNAISANGHPTYFMHTAEQAGGVFDPFFMFYGGTLYAVTGTLSALLGHSPRIAFMLSILVSVAAAYGGLLWLARQLGVRTWMAHAPAVTYVAGAYYVTNIYGRGAWPEFVAASAIPLLVASGFRVARSPRLELLPCALLVASAVIATGSHNITLMWGTVALLAVLALLRLALRRPLAAGRRQLAWLLGLLTLAVCVNAWFLVPNVLQASGTQIANGREYSWGDSDEFNTPRAVLWPLRWVDPSSGTPALYVQAPVWLLAWALGALLVLRRRMAAEVRRAAGAIAAALVAFLALILVEPVYDALPAVLKLVQIPYRLNTYVGLLVAGLVLLGALAAERAGAGRGRRALASSLAAAMAVSVGLCAWQLFVPETKAGAAYADLKDALVSPNIAPRTWYSNEAYLDASAPVVGFPLDRKLSIDPAGLEGGRATLRLTPPPGRQPFAMTMGSGAEIVEMRGLERLGRTRNGFTVARRPEDGIGPVSVTLAGGGSAASAGIVISLLALTGLGALAAVAVVRWRRTRRAPAGVTSAGRRLR